jgi:hypothetical protein
MQFVSERNARQQPPCKIETRFEGVAALYRSLDECVARPPQQCVGVRWDYAFFQMLIETNYLTFLRPDGAPASVLPADNNFAGVGAAVPGRPGERFNDVTTGILAHLQHVLMYSITRIPEPVAKRTRQVQDDVQSSMRRLQRPVPSPTLPVYGPGRTTAAMERRFSGWRKSMRAAIAARPASKDVCPTFAWQSRVGDAGAVEHAHVNAGNSCKTGCVLMSNQREAGNNMPLLFYFPYIVWMGMMQLVQDEMRIPVKIKARPPARN